MINDENLQPLKCNYTYEFPQCSICMEDMVSEMSTSIQCGHTFHSACIFQSLEHKTKCPLCRNRVTAKQLVTLQYEVIKKSSDMQKFFSDLPQEDQKRTLILMQRNEILNEENEKLKYSQKMQDQAISKKDIQLVELKKINEETSKQLTIAQNKKEYQKNHAQKLTVDNNQLSQRIQILNEKVDKYETEMKDLQQYRSMVQQKIIYYQIKSCFYPYNQHYDNQFNIIRKLQDDQQEDKYFQQIREKYPYQEQAKLFYQTIFMQKNEIKILQNQLKNEDTQKKQDKQLVENLSKECQKLNKQLDIYRKKMIKEKEDKQKQKLLNQNHVIQNENQILKEFDSDLLQQVSQLECKLPKQNIVDDNSNNDAKILETTQQDNFIDLILQNENNNENLPKKRVLNDNLPQFQKKFKLTSQIQPNQLTVKSNSLINTKKAIQIRDNTNNTISQYFIQK